MPGSTFRYNESGGWCEVTDVTIRNPSSMTASLGAALAEALRRWDAIGITNFPDPEAQPAKYVVGEPYDVRYSVWPTVLTCRKCRRVHWYIGIEKLRQVNDRLACMSCKGSMELRQIPYAYVCECGRKDTLYIPKHDQKHVITIVDRGRFEDSYWWCNDCHKPLQRTSRDGLGFRPCDCVPRKGKRGVVLQDSRVYYSQTLEMVEVEGSVLERWGQNARFSDLLLAGILGLDAYRPSHLLDLASWKPTSAEGGLSPELRAVREAMIKRGLSEAEADAMVGEGVRAGADDPWQTYDRQLAEFPTLRVPDWSQSRQTVECLFVRDEPSMASITLRSLISDHQTAGDQASVARLSSEQDLAMDLGLVNLRVVEALPTLLGGYGYTRFYPTPQRDDEVGDGDRAKAPVVLRPFPAHENKIPVFVARNTTEALMYELDPWRLAAFMQLNGIAAPPPSARVSDASIKAWLLVLSLPLLQFGESHFVLNSFEAESGKAVEAASAALFGVLHSVSHVLKATAHRYVGMDGDSLAEYLFPAHSTGLVYVSSHVAFTMGGIDSVFRANLRQWLGSAREYAGQCSFDPVCSHAGGACSACLYPKFGCSYFNRTVSRSFLFGGKVLGLAEPIVGLWQPEVTSEAALLRQAAGSKP